LGVLELVYARPWVFKNFDNIGDDDDDDDDRIIYSRYFKIDIKVLP
jgi:hypothetical protein